MRAGVGGPDSPAPVRIYARADRIAHTDCALLDSHEVNGMSLVNGIRVLYPADGVMTFERSGITNLTSSLSIERRAVQDDLSFFSGSKRFHLRVICHDGEHARERRFSFFIAGEHSVGT